MNIDQQKNDSVHINSTGRLAKILCSSFRQALVGCEWWRVESHHALRWYLVMPTQQVGNPVFTQYLPPSLFLLSKKVSLLRFHRLTTIFGELRHNFPKRRGAHLSSGKSRLKETVGRMNM